MPYDVVFSLTSTISRTPRAASQSASARTSSGGRETNAPRKDGIAQNVQRRSQPDASLTGATGPDSSRRRKVRGPPACPGMPTVAAAGGPVRRAMGSSRAAVDRAVRADRATRDHVGEPVADRGVVVEAEDRVRLGQRGGELGAVALGQAADGDDRSSRISGVQDGVDRLALGRLDEPAGVDDGDRGVRVVVDEGPAGELETTGELFGVDTVARAAESER